MEDRIMPGFHGVVVASGVIAAALSVTSALADSRIFTVKASEPGVTIEQAPCVRGQLAGDVNLVQVRSSTARSPHEIGERRGRERLADAVEPLQQLLVVCAWSFGEVGFGHEVAGNRLIGWH